MNTRKLMLRLLAVMIAALLVSALATSAFAQDDTGAADEDTASETVADDTAADAAAADAVMTTVTADDLSTVQTNLDHTWVLLAGFLVFFMQAGFAMLEGGFIRHTGVVNSMIENFMDACVTGIVFFLVGYGLAYGTSSGGLFGTDLFMLSNASGADAVPDAALFVGFFFQFAFAGAAATIATGAMAERTDFRGKLIYSAIVGGLIYPLVVHWIWTADGILAANGFHDFAGSTVVHQTGGIIALMGALVVGPRPGREFGNAPKPHNLMMATLGTFILWFGWYGFNVGSTLNAQAPNIMGLTAVNTTLGASAGALSALIVMYLRSKKWDLGFTLNGSLAGLVAITASCAFVSPGSAIIIGLIAGVIVVFAVDLVESLKIDDAVGAFAVHGACGMFGTLSVGLFGLGHLTWNGEVGLLVGGDAQLLVTQFIGVAGVAVFVAITSWVMFMGIKALGLLRMPAAAEAIGIDAYEHGASMWPDVLPLDDPAPAGD